MALVNVSMTFWCEHRDLCAILISATKRFMDLTDDDKFRPPDLMDFA
jgi:hypothetical protein